MRLTRPALALLALGALAPALLTQGSAVAAAPAAPTYTTFYAPAAADVVEPSLGVDPKSTTAFFSASTATYRVRFDDTRRPARATFTDVSPQATSIDTLDPILFTDRYTGRTFVSQLVLGCSIAVYSDDQFESSHPSEGCGPGSAEDHQTLASGPLHLPLPATAMGKEGAYYCAQNGVDSTCSASADGGVTFGPAVPAFNQDPTAKCQALSGHLKVAKDGTVYLPNKDCGGMPTKDQLTDGLFEGGGPAVSVSTDNGLTWTVRPVPGAHSQSEDDNTVDVSPATGRLWMAWQDGTNISTAVGGTTSSARAAYSDDQGKTWSKTSDLSTPLGLHNVHFATVVTGDPDRAAVSFYGTTGIGDDQRTTFRGDWHYYVATTYDSGRTWATRDVTGKDPVKRNCVDNQGTKPGAANNPPVGSNICPERDFYDFMDIGVDVKGRVLGIFTDACTKKCLTDKTVGQDGTQGVIARQATGKGLYKAFDASLTRVPAATATGTRAGTSPPSSTSPTSSSPVVTSSRSLATTGLPVGAAGLAVGLLGASLLLRRRRAQPAAEV